jgi:HlyD family secretion protein
MVKQTISANGEVKAKKEVNLSFPLSGTLVSLSVEDGDQVKEGDSIAALSSSDAYYTLEAAQDSVDIAKRDRDLFIENYSTKKEEYGGADEYAIQLRKLNELVSKAEASYKSTQETYYKNFLASPLSGLVIDTYYEDGETVAATSSVVKIADPSDLIFEIVIDQEDFGKLKEGQKVEIELDAYEDKIFEGTITSLPKYANGGANPNFTIKISLNSEDNSALIGMTGDAEVIVDSTEGEVNALLYDEIFTDEDNRFFVWTLGNNGNVQKTYVEVGLEGDLYTEIKSELDSTIVVPLNTDADIEEGYSAKITNE